MTRAIILDLDDTLYPERAYAYSGFDVVAGVLECELGDPATSAPDMRRLFESPNRARVFDAYLAARGLADDPLLVRRMIATFRGHTPVISLHEDADVVLTRWRARFRLGLLTDGRSESQWAKIDALNLRPRFDAMIVTSDLGEGFSKPHVGAFEEMARRLGTNPSECTYIADNPAKDFVAPNALGWKSIRIRRADGLYVDTSAPPGGEPHHAISTLHEAESLLA